MSLLIPDGDTLVTYYVLPLVGLNRKSFGNCFKASYVNQEGLKIYVELKKNMVAPSYRTNPHYISEMVIDGTLFVIFTVPSVFIVDVELFIRGQYSEMRKQAKQVIYHTSTLPYNKTMGSFTMSHPVLQALDKTKTLRGFLINELGVTTLAESDELIDGPHESWFIENRIK